MSFADPRSSAARRLGSNLRRVEVGLLGHLRSRAARGTFMLRKVNCRLQPFQAGSDSSFVRDPSWSSICRFVVFGPKKKSATLSDSATANASPIKSPKALPRSCSTRPRLDHNRCGIYGNNRNRPWPSGISWTFGGFLSCQVSDRYRSNQSRMMVEFRPSLISGHLFQKARKFKSVKTAIDFNFDAFPAVEVFVSLGDTDADAKSAIGLVRAAIFPRTCFHFRLPGHSAFHIAIGSRGAR
jgi:hypothetical protein